MTLKTLVENSFADLLANGVGLPAGVTILTGEEDDEQVRPCIVCHCAGGNEEPLGTGNQMMDVEIIIKGQVEDDPDLIGHDALVKFANDILKTDDLAAELSVFAPSYFVFPPVNDAGQTSGVQGRAATHTQRFTVYCCESDLV